MPIKGGYLLLAGGGIVIAWSGIRGKSWSSVLQALIQGRDPRSLADLNAIHGAPAPSGSAPGPGTITGPVSGSERAVWLAMLASMGAPPTPANVRSMVAWRTKESPWNNQPPDGAQFTHNPLNTTFDGGATGTVNSAGVKIYPNWVAGIRATVATLNGYPQILGRLRSGKGLCGWSSDEFLTWSGNGYSSVC